MRVVFKISRQSYTSCVEKQNPHRYYNAPRGAFIVPSPKNKPFSIHDSQLFLHLWNI